MGPAPDQIEHLSDLGPSDAVEFLLTGSEDFDLFPVPESVSDRSHMAGLREAVGQNRRNPERRQEAQRALRKAEARALRELRGWWIRRMRFTSHPLRETMVLFWHGHFTSSFAKVRSAHDLWLQNEMFRRFALGDFRALAREIPQDLAMMRYLDIVGSTKSQPNENFARELMELFLLGEGHYSEEDIREAARAFTGYRIRPLTREVFFQERQFDAGPKTLFGGQRAVSPDDVVEILLGRPQCAPFIAGKLWTFFVGQPPDETIRRTLGESLRGSGFDISAWLRKLLLSEEFYAPQIRWCQIKSPVQWLIGSSKALEGNLDGGLQEQNALRDLGQELFAPPNVKGWEGGRAWISASTFLARNNHANTLFLKPRDSIRAPDLAKIAGEAARRDPEKLCDSLALRLLQTPLPEDERARLLSTIQAYGLPASDKTVSELLRHFLTTPEYQLA